MNAAIIVLLLILVPLGELYPGDAPSLDNNEGKILAVLPREKFKVEQKIVNNLGAKALIQNVVKSCACMEIKINETELADGASTTVSFTIEASIIIGLDRVVVDYDLVTELKTEHRKLIVPFIVNDYLNTKENIVHIDADSRSGSIALERGVYPDQWNKARFAANFTPDCIVYNLEALPNNPRMWSLSVSMRDDSRDFGDFRISGLINYYSDDRILDRETPLSITVRREPPVAVVPRTILLGAVYEGGERVSGFVVKGDLSKLGALTRIDVSDPERVVVSTIDEAPDKVRFELKFKADGKLGNRSGEVILRYESCVVHVPYIVSISPPKKESDVDK